MERVVGAVSSRRGDVDRGHLVADLDLVHDFHPGADLAEMVVDAAGLEERRRPGGDEELRAAHAGGAGRHSNGSARPLGRVALVRQLVGRAPGPIAQRVAALDDEARDDAMEGEVVVEVVLRQVDEVVDGLRRNLGVHECDHEVASRGVHRGGVFLARVDDCRWGRGSLFHAGDDPIVAAGGGGGCRRISARIAACDGDQQQRRDQSPLQRGDSTGEVNQRAGSRAPLAISTASPTASAAITRSAISTLAVAATPPPMSGPMAKPNATELALAPNTVLCASRGVSRPIMLAVAGWITPLNRPFSPTAATTSATHGETAINATATATIAADSAVVRT